MAELHKLTEKSHTDVVQSFKAGNTSDLHQLGKAYCEKYVDVLLDAQNKVGFSGAWDMRT